MGKGKKTFEWLKKIKEMDKNNWLILGLVGVLLLVIAIPTEKKEETPGGELKKQKMGEKENQTETGRGQRGDYKEELEEELTEMLQNMEGVGKVKVMITLKDGGESVVEKDSSDTSNKTEETDKEGASRTEIALQSQKETVYDGKTDSTPFIAKELNPKVEGVLILAEGADNTVVKQNISDAVLALFSVDAHKIKVVKMSVQEENK